VPVGILPRTVDVEAVVGVLDERDAKPASGESGNSFSISVVLPLPENPAKPKTLMLVLRYAA
jgi:hypothetical protein